MFVRTLAAHRADAILLEGFTDGAVWLGVEVEFLLEEGCEGEVVGGEGSCVEELIDG